MNNIMDYSSWQEFLLRVFVSHWVISIILVLLLTAFVGAKVSLNATTRHNVWVLALLGFLLMPLLVFVPKPSVDLSRFNILQSSAPYSKVTLSEPAVVESPTITNAREDRDSDTLSAISVLVQDQPAVTQITTEKYLSVSQVVNGLMIFWLVGALFLIRRLWTEYRAARELELQSDSVPAYFERRFVQLCERLQLTKRPQLRFHAGINAPMTVGLNRVWVAIPMTWREHIDDQVFDQTLTHELGHIARRDPLIHTIQRLMTIVFWMYPAVWYVSRQLELERESACDDWVLTHDGKSDTYASNLLDVAESLYLQPHVLAVGCLRSHSQLSRRIQNLLNKSSDHAVRNSWVLLSGVTAGLLVTLGASALVWPDAKALLVSAQTVEPLAPAQAADPLATVTAQAAPHPASKPAPNPLVQPAFDPKIKSTPSERPVPDSKPVPSEEPAPESDPVPAHQLRLASIDGAPKKYTAARKSPRKTDASEMVISGKHGHGTLTVDFTDRQSRQARVEPLINAHEHPLLYAAWNNDLLSLKRQVYKKDADINRRFDRPVPPATALEAAIIRGHRTIVEALIGMGADLGYSHSTGIDDERFRSPVTLATLVRDREIAQLLLKEGAQADKTTVAIAVQNKDVKLVKMLLKNDVSMDGEVLAIAVQNRDKQMVNLLFKYNSCDCLNLKTALTMAVQNRDVEMINLMLKHDAQVEDGVLMMAVQNRDASTVRSLLKHVDDIDDGALLAALQNQDREIADMLLKAGAEPEYADLIVAIKNHDKRQAKRLLEAGAEIHDGALVLAIQYRDYELINWLLEAGAEPANGAVVMAVQNRDKPLVKQLLKTDPDLEEGALIIAVINQEMEIIEWLIEAGADVEDQVMIVALQTNNSKIIELIRKHYSGDYKEFKKNTWNHKRNKYQAKSQLEHRRDFPINSWPVEHGKISLAYSDSARQFTGDDEPHKALDIKAAAGSRVASVADGEVVESTFSYNYGNFVVVDHGNGYLTKYANNKVNKVAAGDWVVKGQEIGQIGNTANNSAGTHLHFEVKYNHSKMDPEIFLVN